VKGEKVGGSHPSTLTPSNLPTKKNKIINNNGMAKMAGKVNRIIHPLTFPSL